MLWCKAAFYVIDWTGFVSIGRAGRSNNYKVDSFRMTPLASKGIVTANQ